jgi:hypothetical protein
MTHAFRNYDAWKTASPDDEYPDPPTTEPEPEEEPAMLRYNQLHSYLLDAMDDFKIACELNGQENGQITITLKFDKYDEPAIKYTVAKRYESGPIGNELGATLDEFFRREGWNIANNTKLLTSE